MSSVNNLNNLISQNRVNKFIKDSKTIQDANFSTVGKGNIFTHGESNIAYLPQSSFYSIIIGSLLTANKKTRYVLDKNQNDHSVTLNKPVNWNNKGQGYPFNYQNPVAQLLDNSKKIIGYITLDGLIYLTKDLETLHINQLNSTEDSNGLKLLNKNNYGIFIDNENNIYKGNNNTNVWELINSNNDIDDINSKMDKLYSIKDFFVLTDGTGGLKRSNIHINNLNNIDGGSF